MFLDPIFFGMEIWPIDQPANFAALLPPQPPPQRSGAPPAAGRGALGGGTERDEPPDYPWEPSGGRPHPGYDVLVLNDQMDWPENTRTLARQAVDAGRGFVLLHHSLGDNQDWPWWYEEVTGGLLVLNEQKTRKPSTISTAAKLDLRPAGKHPILRNVGPFSLTNEEVYQEHVAVAENHAAAADGQWQQRLDRGVGGCASNCQSGVHSTWNLSRNASQSGIPHARPELDPLGCRTHIERI